MSIRPIIKLPDPILRQKCSPIETIDTDLKVLIDDMLETMYHAPGIGLAASQIGVLQRVLVMDISKDDAPKDPIYLINPEILSHGEDMRAHEEGCLSIPEMYAEIERPALVHVKYNNLEGKVIERDFEGLLATVLQHEVDHLNGVLFIDHLSRLKRDLIVKKFYKAQREKLD